MRRILSASVAAVLAVAAAAPAMAHPKVVSTTPANGTDAANVTQITVTFNEALVPAMSGMDVVMTGMPGMDHHDPMKMTGVKSTVSGDKLTLVAKLPRALPAGTYEAAWHVVSTDTHRVAGKITFTVK